MIQSWQTESLKAVFEGKAPKGFPNTIINRTRRVLAQMNAATDVEQLRIPPGNRLHQLTGDLAGRWSVSINDQYRLVFLWGPDGPEDVWFGDYH